MAKRLSIYLPDTALAALGPGADSVSGRIASIIVRYAGVVADECPEFRLAEWSAIADVLRGTWALAESADSDPARYLWAEVIDAPEIGAKWGIDHGRLAASLRTLSYAQRIATAEVADRFWRDPRRDEMTTLDALIAAGARVTGPDSSLSREYAAGDDAVLHRA